MSLSKPDQSRRTVVYKCTVCGYVYDDTKKSVPFRDLPDDWMCPVCNAPKAAFEPLVEQSV